jgi:hypothetical protein
MTAALLFLATACAVTVVVAAPILVACRAVARKEDRT